MKAITRKNITGGTSLMSIGAVFAGQEQKIDIQYVKSKYDPNGDYMPGTQEIIYVRQYSDHIPVTSADNLQNTR